MSASIFLSNLSWSLPDGVALLTDINLAFGRKRTGIVGRNGAGKTTLLRLIARDLHPTSGRVQIFGSVAMMRQEALEHPDNTIADLFGVQPALRLLERAEAGLASAEDLAEADWTLPTRVESALLECDLHFDPRTPLTTLSGGQRSRAALAALAFTEPDFLLLDEPTNNLDRVGRRAVIDLVRGWRAGAIIVSHDRELLEEMEAIVEISALGAIRYGGNFSAFQQLKEAELDAAQRALAHAEKTHDETARRAQQAVERKARKDSAGKKARAKGDQPKIVMDAAKARAEASSGAGVRLRDARREAADEAVAAARDKIEILQPVHMEVPPTSLSSNRLVLRMDRLTGGHESNNPIIRDVSLTIRGPERIVIAGRNGSGKTTLLNLITGQLSPKSGTVELMVPYAMLDQHVGLLDPTQSVRENYLRLNPSENLHTAHSALARFGFRAAAALLDVNKLSGGERVRAGLACTIGSSPPPQLLILDEPTNHLDLGGIAALEAALAAYDGAVLVISHDETFLKSIEPDRTIEVHG